jgi:hypothetical protein
MKQPKSWAVVLLAMSLCCAAGQERPADSQDNTQAIKNILSEMQAGLHTGFAEKGLARVGDQAADTAVRSNTLEEIRKEPMAIAVAKMIAFSFSNPDQIVIESNKTPKMSVLLLCYLRSSVKTPEGTREVENATQAVDRQLRAQAAQRP